MPPVSTISRKILVVLTWCLSVTAAIACLGVAYQRLGTWLDARRFPQRGKSFQAGAVRLNLHCTGHGRITVILEIGLGGSGLIWVLVQPEVERFTRVCSYDRAGYGWSDPSTLPRTSRQIAVELKGLLSAAGENGPYLLVGHSFGGYNVRVFQALFPKTTAGMVLVDASHPDEERATEGVFSPAQRAQQKEEEERSARWERFAGPIELYLGIERFAVSSGLRPSPNLSRQLAEEFLYLEQQPKYLRVIQEEEQSFVASGAQAVAAGSLGDLPLIVLTAGRPYEADPLVSSAQMARLAEIWIHRLQAEEKRLSNRGRQIVVPNAGHDLPLERPDAVVSAIHSIWSELQQGAAGER